MKVSCGHCSELHDVSKMEPSYAMPDCIVDMGRLGYARPDVLTSKDICAIRSAKRGFLRSVLPIPVEGEAPCNWGIWVELFDYEEFLSIVHLWHDDALLKKTAAGKLANDLSAYPGSLGLCGTVSFPTVNQVGRFSLADFPRADLPTIVRDYHEGVTVARKLEWLLPMLHAEGGN